MTVRMEKTRETLGNLRYLTDLSIQRLDAALAEVEEWETRLARHEDPFIARDQLPAAFELMKARAEAAEAERDRLRAILVGVRDRDRVGDIEIGPCFCPDWEVEGWDKSVPPEEWVHHPVCAAARAALGEQTTTTEKRPA